MYIRWIVRRHKNASTANVVFHDAYLVESFRDLRETPRQRMVCYLGNIRQIDDEFPAIERELFLLRAERILASTPGVSATAHRGRGADRVPEQPALVPPLVARARRRTIAGADRRTARR